MKIPYRMLMAQKSKLEKFEKSEPLLNELELIDTILLYCTTRAHSTQKNPKDIYKTVRKEIADNRKDLWHACKRQEPLTIQACLQKPLTFSHLKAPTPK